jgi:hypothetical protein
MDLLELAISLVEKGGAIAGLGGGSAVTYFYTRIEKKLKDIRDKATAAHSLAQNAATQTELKALRNELSRFRDDVAKAFRGSHSGLETKTGERLAALESRMSGLEDDLDAKTREDQKSWEAIQRAVGRIEGTIARDQST